MPIANENRSATCLWISSFPSLGSPKHLNFTAVSQYQFQHWTHCPSVQRRQNFNEGCPSHHNWKHHLYHRSSGILSLLCLYMSSWREIYTHTHKQYSLGLLIVYFLCSLLQGRAKNELAWHIRIQTFFVLFCRPIDIEEVTVPLISPVKPLTASIRHICLCHRIKNDFQTQPPLLSGFLRPHWLVVESEEELADPKIAGVPAAQTHCHQGLVPTHS